MAMKRLGKQCIELNDLCVCRGSKRVLWEVNWIIKPGDRIGILGENGAGKTTLLKVLDGTLHPTYGKVKVGQTVHFASLSQNLDELAPFEDDIVRVLLGRYKTYYVVEGKKMSPTALMERLGFTQDHLNARVKDLSGGQRRRLQLLLTLLEEPNVLILDEPGNDLDTDMLAIMEDLLDSWPGTLLVVSHDRHLIERVTDDQYAIIGTNVRHVPGGIDEYFDLLEEYKQAEKANSKPAEKKQLHSTERKMQNQRKRVEEAKAALEAADPYNYEELAACQAKILEQQAILDELEETWLELSEQLEA